MTDDNNLPKQELLIKLLRMTESPNDGEALTALRKANAFIKGAGWDWERLINAKVKIVANPFAGGLKEPPSNRSRGNGTAPVQPFAPSPPRPAPPPRPTPPPPPPPPIVSKTTWPIGINPNRFASPCYCCGIDVVAQAGLIFRPVQYHSRASIDWKVVCRTCNTKATIDQFPAQRQKRGRRANVSDLA